MLGEGGLRLPMYLFSRYPVVEVRRWLCNDHPRPGLVCVMGRIYVARERMQTRRRLEGGHPLDISRGTIFAMLWPSVAPGLVLALTQ